MERPILEEKEKFLDRQANTILVWAMIISPFAIAALVAFAIFVLANK